MSKAVRLLMGIPSKNLRMGGPITHLPYLVDYFAKHESYIIKTFDYGSKIDGGSLIDKKESITRKVINTIGVFTLFVFYVIKFRPNIIHLNTAFDKKSLLRDIPFSLFCYFFRCKLIFKLHGSSNDLIFSRKKVLILLIRMFFLGANKIGVLSELEKKDFTFNFKNTKKVIVVKNIVNKQSNITIPDTKYFERDPAKIYGLFVSRIIQGKGLDDLISAIPLINKNHPNFILVVAGDGPEKKALMDFAVEQNIDKQILWLGFVPNEELQCLYTSTDLFLFPSHLPEGMPMSLVDALRIGIPLITTKVRFALNYLEDNVNCLFIEMGNISDIANKVDKLLGETELANKMREQNPKMVERFSQHKVGKEFERIYEEMLNTNIVI